MTPIKNSPSPLSGVDLKSCHPGRYFLIITGFILVFLNTVGIGLLYSKVQNLDPTKIADAVREDKYNEYGGKDIYELNVKAAKLQSADRKAQYEA